MKNEETNEADLSFVAFLIEYLPYVESHVPTRINMGGAGHYALALSEILSFMKIEHELVRFAIPEGPLLERARERGGDDYMHFAVKLHRNLYFDCSGILGKDHIALEHITTTAEAISKENESETVNPIFDLECIPIIKEKLSEMPYDYGNWLVGEKYPYNFKLQYTDYTLEVMRKVEEIELKHQKHIAEIEKKFKDMFGDDVKIHYRKISFKDFLRGLDNQKDNTDDEL